MSDSSVPLKLDTGYLSFSQTLPSLKGFAILMVVMYHLWGYTRGYLPWTKILEQAQGQGLKGWLEGGLNVVCLMGEQGVHFFLIASGFGLAASWWRQSNGQRTPIPFRVIPFWRRRLARLMPLYWLANGWAIALFCLNHDWVPYGSAIWDQGVLSIAIAIGASLTTLRNFLVNYYSFLNGAWWYVGLSAQLYLIFPFLVWIGRRWGWSVLLGSALILSLSYRCAVVLLNDSLEPHMVEVLLKGAFFPSRLFEFTFGMILAIALLKLPLQASKHASKDLVLSVSQSLLLDSRWRTIAAMLWLVGISFDELASTGQIALAIPADALIGVGELCLFYQLFRSLPSLQYWLSILGNYSYGIFLTHMNIFVGLWIVLSPGLSNYWLRFAIVTAITCGLGVLFEWSYGNFQQAGKPMPRKS